MNAFLATYARDAAMHVVVSSILLAVALITTRWIRPLTARTRHAILRAGMASLLVPSALITRMIERSGTIVVVPLRNAIAPLPAAFVPENPAPSFPWATAVAALWALIAIALLFRTLVIARRLLAGALRAGSPPPPRTIAALDAARRRLGVRTSIELLASPLCEAPAVVRVLRPIIVLPADGCQSLDDDELESLLCHECAHVARRDNLAGLVEAIAGAVFWFNPLVWIARRRMAAAREEACDERVADAAMPAETYVGALAKLGRTLIAPRVAAVSCMANAHLKERIEHLMNYDTLRSSALSHRFTAAAAAVTVVLSIVAAGIVTASPASADSGRYLLNYSITRPAPEMLVFHTKIVDTQTQSDVGESKITVTPGVPGSAQITRDDSRWLVDVNADAEAKGSITLTVWTSGVEVQKTVNEFGAAQIALPRAHRYVGQPISLDLLNADIRDVLRAFGELASLEMSVAPEVTGVVTVRFKDTPWDEALERMLRENGYAYRMEGKTIRIFKP